MEGDAEDAKVGGNGGDPPERDASDDDVRAMMVGELVIASWKS